MWCITECNDYQIKCPGGVDDNGCKEADVCIDRPLNPIDNTLCPGFCPVECHPVEEHICSEPDNNGCPEPPSCKTKEVNHEGEFCDEQHCNLVCDTPFKFCSGEQMIDGCYDADVCVPKGKTTDESTYCDGNCPITCKDSEILCDGQIIYGGEKDGCKAEDICKQKARDNNGVYCPDASDSHECPITCPDDSHLCPTRLNPDGCKEQATCTPCTYDIFDDCCPQASDCPALCQPHEEECEESGWDDNGCPIPPTCVVVERDYYGFPCPVHCPGECNSGQIECPGGRDEDGCIKPSFCVPLAKKLWGDDAGAWCPGFCPPDCKDWENHCSSVQDPCDGCPTEPVCKPKAKDSNGIYCPSQSASHGCSISCKTLDGMETICASYEDPANPGCLEPLTCLPRTKGTDGALCPSHSVCPKRCRSNEKQCVQGIDANGCKEEDLCIPKPLDVLLGQPCLDFECPPKCDEENQKYCQGQYQINSNGQLCPQRDYCVDRQLDYNNIMCPGHCLPDCPEGQVGREQSGLDERGCPLPGVCE